MTLLLLKPIPAPASSLTPIARIPENFTQATFNRAARSTAAHAAALKRAMSFYFFFSS